MKISNNAVMTLAALVLALTPTLALAHTTPVTGGHAHASNSAHDRSPRMHDHTPVAHH
jgi:hypothetical protein